RLDAALVADMAGATALLDRSGQDGGAALLAGQVVATGSAQSDAAAEGSGKATNTSDSPQPPAAGAVSLCSLLSGSGAVLELARKLLADAWVVESLQDLREGFAGTATTRSGRVLFAGWGEVRQVAEGGAERVLAKRNERDRLIAESEQAAAAEHAAGAELEQASERVRAADAARDRADGELREADRRLSDAAERQRKAGWLIEQRRAAPEQGPLAVKRAQLEGELAAERRALERRRSEEAERARRIARLLAQRESDLRHEPRAERLAAACLAAGEALVGVLEAIERLLDEDRAAGEQVSAELRACAQEEAEIQSALRVEGEAVTGAEVAAQRLRDQAAEAEQELATVCERLELALPEVNAEPLGGDQEQALRARLERLARRREQLGPVNPLAGQEYAEALAHVEELEERRTDLETALRELRGVIRETDRQIHETFNATFEAAARNFEELVGDVFPGGSGRLRLVNEEQSPQPVLGGQADTVEGSGENGAEAGAEAELEDEAQPDGEQMQGVEIEITPAGKSAKRLSLLSGGEKSMTALAFLFAVFLARPCPFYVLDEVEAALDDLNLDRFLTLLRRYADRAQFIVITHQKRTMEAADWLYGVSMAENGVSKVLSRRLPAEDSPQPILSPQVAPVA
ncbi:MAG TPA: AAA family ATPase, partial [Solirubrobacteraceae bacterium]|nr:AAA family ATPase [Solirubrobacteraceae bacterium]